MKKRLIVVKKPVEIRHPEECKRIAGIMRKQGFACDTLQAQTLWMAHSEAQGAWWLILPGSDKFLFGLLHPYFTLSGQDDE